MDSCKDRLREAREDRGLTQSEVANILGITQQVYSRYERGIYEIPLRHLIALCDYYQVSAGYLLGREPFQKRDLHS